jgi:hypothetical protein
VWLTTNFAAEYGYEKRIDVTDCSGWEVRLNSVLNKPTSFNS